MCDRERERERNKTMTARKQLKSSIEQLRRMSMKNFCKYFESKATLWDAVLHINMIKSGLSKMNY